MSEDSGDRTTGGRTQDVENSTDSAADEDAVNYDGGFEFTAATPEGSSAASPQEAQSENAAAEPVLLGGTFDTSVEMLAVLTASSPSVIVGVPAYDEADTIEDVVSTARQYADAVLVVDDGSDDDTAARAQEAGAFVISHDRNRGKGAALKTIFSVADRVDAGELVLMDGDGQHDPGDIPKLLAERRDRDVEIVIGSRFVDGAKTRIPIYRVFGIQLINVVFNLSMGAARRGEWVRDTQSGYRAYGQAAIESIASNASLSDNMAATTDILQHALARDYDIAEVGTTMTYSVPNANTQNPVVHGLTVVFNVLRAYGSRRPLAVFGVPGVLTMGFAIALSRWGGRESTGLFPEVAGIGLFVLGCLFVAAAVMEAVSSWTESPDATESDVDSAPARLGTHDSYRIPRGVDIGPSPE